MDWIGITLVIVSVFLYGQRKVLAGAAFAVVGGTFWGLWGVQEEIWSAVVINVVLGGVHVWNLGKELYIGYRRKEHPTGGNTRPL